MPIEKGSVGRRTLGEEKSMIRVGFEPTPFRTSALSWRLRPLGHLTFVTVLRPHVRPNASALSPIAEMLLLSRRAFSSKTHILTIKVAQY